jgi:hypothetical protein
MGTTTPRLSAAEVKGLFEKLSNWGRWGKDDERGALNFITLQKRAAAGRLVQSGETVAMALPLATTSGPDNPTPVTHVMLYSGPGLAAALVVLAPAAPVAELLEQALHFGGAEPGCAGAHRPLPNRFVRRPAIPVSGSRCAALTSARMLRCLSQLIARAG